jgi:hypothetical protein
MPQSPNFTSSAEATEFFDQLTTMLRDPRAQHWMSQTAPELGSKWSEQADNLSELVEQLDNPEYN